MITDYEFLPEEVAERWAVWCGENQWTKQMRELQKLNCKIIWHGGFPRSASAIPLCFVIVKPNGEKIGTSRLKDINQTIKELTI